MTELQPAPVHDGRRLDWFPRFDPASRRYAAAPGVSELPGSGRLWNPGKVLDQGSEGACVGFACAGRAAAEPDPVRRVTNAYALGWYRNAQRRDEWPGEAYDGTSVLAGMQEGKARRLFPRYLWAFSVEELAHGIVRPEEEDGGPAVIGVEWRSGSYSTDPRGILRPSGRVVGGHALCLLGFLPAMPERGTELEHQLVELELMEAVAQLLVHSAEPGVFIGLNSWGPTFGRGGLFVVSVSTVRGWFAARGEFALPGSRRALERGRTAMAEPEDQDDQSGDSTLHITAADVLEGDRILDPPDAIGQESVTVRSAPKMVSGWQGRRVVIDSTAGVFQLGASDPVTVRRQT